MKIFIPFIFLFLCFSALADEPITLLFQGQLNAYKSANVMDSTRIMFSIYTNPFETQSIWSEDHLVNIHEGIVNVELGMNNKLSVDFSKELWLGMTIEDKEILPRMKISSVPKAIHALVADSLSSSFKKIVTSINGTSGDLKLSVSSPLILQKNKDTIHIRLDSKQFMNLYDSMLIDKYHDKDISISFIDSLIRTTRFEKNSCTREQLQSGVIPVLLSPEGVAGGNLTGKNKNLILKEGCIEEQQIPSLLRHQLLLQHSSTVITGFEKDTFSVHDVMTTIPDTLLYFAESRSSTSPNTPIRAHMLMPKGNDYDIDLVLSPKGIGSLLTAMPDDSYGGMKRGIQAIDLQLSRSLNHQIASGDYSSLLAGMNNVAKGHTSTVIGGMSNNAEGTGSAIVGGYNNIASGTNSFSTGWGNTALGNATIALGISNTSGVESSATIAGKNNYAGAAHAIVMGGNFTHVTAPSGSAIGSINSSILSSQASTIGGKNNTIAGAQSIILGGNGLTLSHSAINSIGTLANNQSLAKHMIINAPNTFIMGNMDIWLASNDNVSRGIYFFEPGSTQGNYPGEQHYTMLRAGTQQQHISYTLPISPPTQSSQVLTSSPAGQMSWGLSIQLCKNMYIDCPQLLPAGGTSYCDIRIQGVQVGGVVHISPKSDLPQGICIASIRVLQNNIVRIAFMNATDRIVDPPPMISDIAIMQ